MKDSITFHYSANGQHLTINCDGRRYDMDLSSTPVKDRCAYMNSVRKWRQEGSKGFPPLPMIVAL